MIYRFDDFELDLFRFELRARRARIPVEPQVFSLLTLLVENHERVVSRDEIVEKVWDGRVVSEAAVSSRIKSARKALGDDGRAQRFIRTVHGRGFRFVSDPTTLASPGSTSAEPLELVDASAPPPAREADRAARPSIAVLPFRLVGDAGGYEAIARALPHELIEELSRLRWLFVTARASTFRIGSGVRDPGEVGRLFGVGYCLSGTVELSNDRLAVAVELVDTRSAEIVWADRLVASLGDVHSIRSEIRSRVLAALEIQIPIHEAAQARLRVTEDLDAWSAYHLGLQHMFRFNRSDNEAAASLFARAVALDPSFARGHAGLSFVHFQDAFLHYTDDRSRARRLAREFAERGLALDPIDPFLNFTMGRSYWLEGDLESSLPWLDRAIAVCPNYAQGLYARGWTEALTGDARASREHLDLAMRLSPLDPLLYAMSATRALTHVALGEDRDAANWSDRAARSPGAHVLIAMIAAGVQALAGDPRRAGWWAGEVRRRNPTLGRRDFFDAFPLRSMEMRQRFSEGLERLGF